MSNTYSYDDNGNIIGISNGSASSAYTYDAWGNILTTTGSMASTLGAYNPLRYRGYVYDQETGLYYLQSRYYNPEMGRFINADTTNVLTATPYALTDKNLFAYCDNNPIVRADYGGEFWLEIGLAVAITASIVAVGALIVATGGLAAVAVAGGGTVIVATSTTTAALGVATIAGEVALGGIVIYAGAAVAEEYISYSAKPDYDPDPYKRPDQKRQGRETKKKNRKKENYSPRNNRRDNKPAPPKHHTPGRDHRCFKHKVEKM